jgi:hypothetical protein
VNKVTGKVGEEKLGMELTGVGRVDLADDGFVPVSWAETIYPCRQGSIYPCRQGSICPCRVGSICPCRMGSICSCKVLYVQFSEKNPSTNAI